MLGRVVGREPFATPNARHRGGIDDRAAALLDHYQAGELEAPVNSVQIDSQRIRVKLLRGRQQRRHDPDTGVVEHDIEAAELLTGRAYQRLDRFRLAHIGRDEEAPNRVSDRLAFAVGQIANHDLSSFLGEQFGRGLADARSTAGDYGHPARNPAFRHFYSLDRY